MDLRLTQTELEIKHGTAEDIEKVISTIQHLINFKVETGTPMTVVGVEPSKSLLDAPVEDLLDKPVNTSYTQENLVEDILEVLNTPPVEPVKKKLVFVKCPECETTFCSMTEIHGDLAPTMKCKCGEHFIAHDLMRGSYECECGQKGFFLMTPQVNVVKCRECKEDIFMVYDQAESKYVGYLD